MIVVLERYKSEWLQHSLRERTPRVQHLGHAMDWAGLGLKRDFDKIAFRERLGQSQQPTGHGHRLEARFGAISAI